ncbi:hypothetical protein Ancab_023674 [Ancistrocladus abbreviatus]
MKIIVALAILLSTGNANPNNILFPHLKPLACLRRSKAQTPLRRSISLLGQVPSGLRHQRINPLEQRRQIVKNTLKYLPKHFFPLGIEPPEWPQEIDNPRIH